MTLALVLFLAFGVQSATTSQQQKPAELQSLQSDKPRVDCLSALDDTSQQKFCSEFKPLLLRAWDKLPQRLRNLGIWKAVVTFTAGDNQVFLTLSTQKEEDKLNLNFRCGPLGRNSVSTAAEMAESVVKKTTSLFIALEQAAEAHLQLLRSQSVPR